MACHFLHYHAQQWVSSFHTGGNRGQERGSALNQERSELQLRSLGAWAPSLDRQDQCEEPGLTERQGSNLAENSEERRIYGVVSKHRPVSGLLFPSSLNPWDGREEHIATKISTLSMGTIGNSFSRVLEI